MTQKNLFSFKRPKLENSLLSFGQQFWGLFLLSACGSGGGVSVQISNGTTGTVIDGYISGARVFGDINNNKKLDSGESFVLTNSSGRFSGLQKSVASTIIADNNSGQAKDMTTGLNFAFIMAAPEEYIVITPITTLVAGLVEGGDELSVAEKKLKYVLSLDEHFQLGDYDPFLYLGKSTANSQQLSDAENYQLAAVKIANLLIARDGNYFNTTDEGFSDFLGHLSQIIDQKYKSGTKLNLGEKSDLGLLLTDRSAAELENLADLNTAEDYYSILDKQLLKLSSKTITISDSDDGDKFVTVQINANFERTGNYSLTLENNITKATITSTQLTAVGNNVAVFKFSANDIESVGFGSLSATVKNTITGEVLDTNFSVQVNRDVSFDDSSSSEEVETQSFDSGVVADGYISNARVFRDENENDQFDAGEIYVLTNSDGEFTNLGGNAAKPIVADGNNGQAVDTSTGITFNSVLSAPAGSKVVNPITTIVNELIQDDTSSASSADKIASANEKVATALGLTAVKNGY